MCSRNISFCITYLTDLVFFKGLSCINNPPYSDCTLCPTDFNFKKEDHAHIVILGCFFIKRDKVFDVKTDCPRPVFALDST